jgi:PAS domain S-box-containing protein
MAKRKDKQAQSSPPADATDTSHTDMEDRLRRAEERFRLFMENVKEYAVFMLDPEGRVVDWNLGAEHVLGYGEEIMGQPFAVFFPPEDTRAGIPEKELKTATETGQASDDRWHVRKDGTFFWAFGITTAMRDDDGTLKGFTKVLRDSTERKHFEEQLEQRNKALKEADRRKDEFLAMLAHELRNPLAPIFNALAIMEQENLPAGHHRQARQLIDRQARILARLIDDLLDVSRIASGKIQLRKASVELKVIVENAAKACRPIMVAQHHKLTVSLPAHPIWLDADQTRMEQVVVNLLNNAAKYSEEGGNISVTVAQEQDRAIVRVRDTGVGISPELLPVVFDLFTQGERSLSRSQGGLGIGLSLVKKLVELHGGKVEAHSEGSGKGSEFVLRLPVRNEISKSLPHNQTATAPKKAEKPLSVLIVDDSVDAAESLRMLLGMSGHQVEMAHDGKLGIKMADEKKPDVMIVDIGLPGLNGYQVAERVRETPHLKGVVLVAVTGYGQEEDRRRSADAGFDYHLVKPVDPQKMEQLLALIGKLMKRD